MLRNRLLVLMAERLINVSEVSKGTGLSRTTLTHLKYQREKRYDLKTINMLCQYFGITPGELFEYERD